MVSVAAANYFCHHCAWFCLGTHRGDTCSSKVWCLDAAERRLTAVVAGGNQPCASQAQVLVYENVCNAFRLNSVKQDGHGLAETGGVGDHSSQSHNGIGSHEVYQGVAGAVLGENIAYLS